MRYLKNKIWVLSAIVLICSTLQAQSFDDGGSQWMTPEHLGQPKFHVSVVERIAVDTALCRIDLFVNILNDFMQFVRTDSGEFEAEVEINLSVGLNGSEVQRLHSKLTQQTTVFEETNSRHHFLTGQFSIEQPAGEYLISILLVDKESNRREKAEKKLQFRKIPGVSIALSDIILTKSNEFSPDTRTPKQMFAAEMVSAEDEVGFAFFDLRRDDTASPCQVNLTLFDDVNEILHRDSLSVIGGLEISAYTIPFPTTNLKFGKYRIDLLCSQGSERVFRSKHFDVNSNGLPRTIQNLDLSIKQLKYIATEKEIESLETAFSSEKEKAFLDYWGKNFPTDGEKINGKMVEYYSRVSYANEQFTTGMAPGWETDRGRILIIYGKPTEIERNVFEQDGTPYEVWYYSHLGKHFTFRDEYQFGDYRLVTPEW